MNNKTKEHPGQEGTWWFAAGPLPRGRVRVNNTVFPLDVGEEVAHSSSIAGGGRLLQVFQATKRRVGWRW